MYLVLQPLSFNALLVYEGTIFQKLLKMKCCFEQRLPVAIAVIHILTMRTLSITRFLPFSFRLQYIRKMTMPFFILIFTKGKFCHQASNSPIKPVLKL